MSSRLTWPAHSTTPYTDLKHHTSVVPTRYPYTCSQQPSADNVDGLQCSQRVHPTLYMVVVTMLCASATAASYSQVGERMRSHANATSTSWLVGWYWLSVIHTQSVYLYQYICTNFGSRASTNVITLTLLLPTLLQIELLVASTWPRRCAL